MIKGKSLLVTVLSALFLTVTAKAVESDPLKVEKKSTVQVEAEVVSVNKKTRELKLKSKSGEVVSLVAGDEVRNFDQIKKGDRLKVDYLESLTLELIKGGKEPVVSGGSVDIERSRPGQKPSGKAVAKVTARGTVINVDSENQNITVKGPKRTVLLHIEKKENLDKIKKGDQIEATYIEAMAVSVESVKK